MDRSKKHRIAELSMAVGFIATIGGGLGAALILSSTSLSIISGVGGFTTFLIGVEIYLKTRKELHEY